MGDRKGHRSSNRQNRGVKRDHRGEAKKVDENSPVIKAFRCYQQELDQRYDKHERIVKLSRDITIESKRIIFLLHRVSGTKDVAALMKEAGEKLTELEETKFKKIAEEVFGTDPHQFVRAYSPGLQEFIEALSFYIYLKDKRLMSLEEVQSRLTFYTEKQSDSLNNEPAKEVDSSQANAQPFIPVSDQCDISSIEVPVPPVEYMLGIADLTGEVMRLAINSIGSGNLELPHQIRAFMQEMEAGYAGLDNTSREISRKLYTLKQSARKVETACYTLQIRGSEIPKHMLADTLTNDHLNAFSEDQIHDEN